MTDRDRLIELLTEAEDICGGTLDCDECKYSQSTNCNNELKADHLLANGVVVPPCKVGQTVYRVMSDKRIKKPYQYKVIGFWYSADETCNNLHLVRYVNGVFDSSMSVPFSEFNRILFLTKEEAEQALKEIGKEDEGE